MIKKRGGVLPHLVLKRGENVKFKKIFISLFLCVLFVSIFSFNAFATDDEFVYGKENYTEYNITLEYPGYFIDSITLFVFNNGAPDWNSEIVMGTPDVRFSILSDDTVQFVFNNPEHYFAGKEFRLCRNRFYVTELDIIENDNHYYLELVDNGNTFSIVTDYTTYYYDKPSSELCWSEYISQLGHLHDELFFVYDEYVFFNGYALKTIDGEYVQAHHIVNFERYTQSSNYHGHNWVDTRTVIQSPNCQRPLIIVQECTACGNTREYTDYSYVGNYHSYVEYSGVSATCLESGYSQARCELCGEEYYEVLEPLGHRFRSATCMESGKCIRSGCIAAAEALGHDLNFWGNCTRGGCDYKSIDVQGALSSAGTNISNWWQGSVSEPTNDIVQKAKEDIDEIIKIVSDSLTNIGEGSKNFGDNILSYGKVILILFLSIPVIIVIYLIAYWGAKLVKLVKENISKKKGR